METLGVQSEQSQSRTSPAFSQPPSEERINGILLGFRVRYRELLYDRLRSFTVRTVNSPSTTWAELTCE